MRKLLLFAGLVLIGCTSSDAPECETWFDCRGDMCVDGRCVAFVPPTRDAGTDTDDFDANMDAGNDAGPAVRAWFSTPAAVLPDHEVLQVAEEGVWVVTPDVATLVGEDGSALRTFDPPVDILSIALDGNRFAISNEEQLTFTVDGTTEWIAPAPCGAMLVYEDRLSCLQEGVVVAAYNTTNGEPIPHDGTDFGGDMQRVPGRNLFVRKPLDGREHRLMFVDDTGAFEPLDVASGGPITEGILFGDPVTHVFDRTGNFFDIRPEACSLEGSNDLCLFPTARVRAPLVYFASGTDKVYALAGSSGSGMRICANTGCYVYEIDMATETYTRGGGFRTGRADIIFDMKADPLRNRLLVAAWLDDSINIYTIPLD